MKLLFTFFVPSGGVETLNRFRCRALLQAGIECHLLYKRDGAGRQNILDIPHYITDRDEDLRHIIASHHYDAIIVTCDHLMLLRLREAGYQGPLIYEAQGLGTLEAGANTMNEGTPFIRQYACGAISTPTPHLMQLYHNYLAGFPCFYVNNFIDTSVFHHEEAPWLNPTGQPILAWIGRLESNKNWMLFLQAGAELIRRVPELQLWMFEDPNLAELGERERFQAAVAELNLHPHLSLKPNIPHSHMPYYYSAIGDYGGMLMSTSRVEGFGYVVAEAMSCGCPVLSTDSDGVRSLIQPEVTGKLFSSGTVMEGVDQALDLLYNKPKREALKQNALLHIHTSFSPARYTADIVNVLVALGIRRFGS
ncbi:glycosyltransferase family 4 protein [Paenibacillus sp. GCM10023252]|uniref:glycosyltransferase family 4 protein n=1 Tax=Paenibacillus sp. GCM10023252 TaxID=3252649 RepID=UPI00360AEA05